MEAWSCNSLSPVGILDLETPSSICRNAQWQLRNRSSRPSFRKGVLNTSTRCFSLRDKRLLHMVRLTAPSEPGVLGRDPRGCVLSLTEILLLTFSISKNQCYCHKKAKSYGIKLTTMSSFPILSPIDYFKSLCSLGKQGIFLD